MAQAPTFQLDPVDQPFISGPTSTPGAAALPAIDGGRAARVLREWVAEAGGWNDAGIMDLPVALPKRLALATLKTHARALGMQVSEEKDVLEPMA
jgi:hypothetical protein